MSHGWCSRTLHTDVDDLFQMEDLTTLCMCEDQELEDLEAITSQPTLIASTTKRLATYIESMTDNGEAKELDEQVSSYCGKERTTDESYQKILKEMRDRSLLNAVGRNLLAVTGYNPQQRWKEFLRTLVERTTQDPHRRASDVIDGLNRERMALALEYTMGTPIGLQIALKAQDHMRAKTEGTRTIAGLLKHALENEEILTSIATTLLQWAKTRQPLESFQAWIKQITLESRTPKTEGANATPPIPEETEQREDEELTQALNTLAHASAPDLKYSWDRTHRRIVTYNVNSLVAALARPEGRLLTFISRNRADVYAIQETMVDTSLEMKGSKWKISPFCRRLKAMGYHAYWHAGTRAHGGYGGTLFLSLVEPENVIIGTGDCQIDSEGRFMSLVFSDAVVTNLYAPTLNMELKGQQRKTDFWQAAEKRHRQIQRRYPGRSSIWAGDMNVAPASKDAAAVGIRRRLELMAPKTAALLKDELPSQTQHERDELQQLQDRLGLVVINDTKFIYHL